MLDSGRPSAAATGELGMQFLEVFDKVEAGYNKIPINKFNSIVWKSSLCDT